MERKRKIIANKVRCKICGEVIESIRTHDFVGCKCWNESNGKEGIAIDGGHSYLSRTGSFDAMEELSETRPYTDEERDEWNEKEMMRAEQWGGWYKPCIME